MIETIPLERAAEADARMMRNEARFRIVLTADQPDGRAAVVDNIFYFQSHVGASRLIGNEQAISEVLERWETTGGDDADLFSKCRTVSKSLARFEQPILFRVGF